MPHRSRSAAMRSVTRHGFGDHGGPALHEILLKEYKKKYVSNVAAQPYVTAFFVENNYEQQKKILKDLGLGEGGIKLLDEFLEKKRVAREARSSASVTASKERREAASASRRYLPHTGGRRRKGTRKMRRTRSKRG